MRADEGMKKKKKKTGAVETGGDTGATARIKGRHRTREEELRGKRQTESRRGRERGKQTEEAEREKEKERDRDRRRRRRTGEGVHRSMCTYRRRRCSCPRVGFVWVHSFFSFVFFFFFFSSSSPLSALRAVPVQKVHGYFLRHGQSSLLELNLVQGINRVHRNLSPRKKEERKRQKKGNTSRLTATPARLFLPRCSRTDACRLFFFLSSPHTRRRQFFFHRFPRHLKREPRNLRSSAALVFSRSPQEVQEKKIQTHATRIFFFFYCRV